VSVALSIVLVTADPTGPDSILTAGSGFHTNETGPIQIGAKAGNVTGLRISSTRSTESWQGYYGNVTGTITLDDANNYTLYDWSLPTPSGEVYAVNSSSTVTWGIVYCMNVSPTRGSSGGTAAGTGGNVAYKINASQIELNFGINTTDLDGLNETFWDVYTDATGFTVGAVTIDVADGCSSAHPYTDQATDSNWVELLLSDNTSLIFASVIRNSADGFQPGASDNTDFEMVVLENGHTQQSLVTTPYYFYVELS
jgi:hypothetical protein